MAKNRIIHSQLWLDNRIIYYLFILVLLFWKSLQYDFILVLQLCEMVSLQRYTKALTNLQRAQLVEKTRQKPQVRRQALEDVCGKF